jgi:hypothetical protein
MKKSRKYRRMYTLWAKNRRGDEIRVGVQFSKLAAERVRKQHDKRVDEGLFPGESHVNKITKMHVAAQ